MKPLQDQVHSLFSKIFHIDYAINLAKNHLSIAKSGSYKDTGDLITDCHDALSILDKAFTAGKVQLKEVENEIKLDDEIYGLTKEEIRGLYSFFDYVIVSTRERKLQSEPFLNIKEVSKDTLIKYIESFLSYLEGLNNRKIQETNALERIKKVLIEHGKYYPGGVKNGK